MSRPLAAVDVVIIVLYVLGTTLLGAWFGRRQRDLRTYFVGDRNVSWWLVLISIVATETSTVTFLSVPGVAYNPQGGNMTFLQLPLGYCIGRCMIAWLILPQYMHGELFSAYQVLRERFNSAVQRAASALFLLTRTVADGLRLYLAALLLQQFTGWDSTASILAIGLATMLYTYLGGVQAVIWTDLVQFVIYIAGALLAGTIMLGQMSAANVPAPPAEKFRILDLSSDLTQPYTLWAGLIGGAFLTMASHGADHMMVQRYLCSRSLGEARLALIASGVVVLLQFLLFLLLGIGLYVLATNGLLPGATELKNDEVFGHYIVGALPHGLVGLVIAAVLAAAMSTLASSLNSSAGAFVADFYQPLNPGQTERHYLNVSRTMTSVWGFARIAVALAAVQLLQSRSIINEVLAIASFTTGMVLGLFLLGRMRRPVPSNSALIGLATGFVAVLAAWAPSVVGKPVVAWPWYAPIGTVVTVAAAWTANRWRPRDGSLADGGT
jgi:SSS family transporter